MHPIDELLDQWEIIVKEVNKTDVPLECIKKIVIKLNDGKQRTINLHTLIKQGLQIDDIESLVARTFSEMDADINIHDSINKICTIIKRDYFKNKPARIYKFYSFKKVVKCLFYIYTEIKGKKTFLKILKQTIIKTLKS